MIASRVRIQGEGMLQNTGKGPRMPSKSGITSPLRVFPYALREHFLSNLFVIWILSKALSEQHTRSFDGFAKSTGSHSVEDMRRICDGLVLVCVSRKNNCPSTFMTP
jgi:hypothetical protein